MKNKKLFAILTLVCFMFTLMPVAAFAADAPSKAVNVYVEETADNWTDDATVTAGTFDVKVATTTSGSVSVTAEDYVFYAVDENGEGAAVALSDAAGKATLEILVAGDYKVYAAVAAGVDVDTLLSGVDTVANKVAKVEAWAVSSNKVVDEYAIVEVEAPEFVYQIVMDENNSAKAGYINSNVTGAFGSDAFSMSIEASNGFNKDGGVIATLYKASASDYKTAKDTSAAALETFKTTASNWTVVKNQELTISEAGYVDVAYDTLKTDNKGQVYFVVTADLANAGNKVIVKFGNEAKATLTVNATNNQVANVVVNNQPLAPTNNENPIIGANVEFKFTDKNGVAVELDRKGTTGTDAITVADSDVVITVVEKPAKSSLKDSDLILVKQPASGTLVKADKDGVYTLAGKVMATDKFDKDGTYVIKVALKNGAAAEATVKVAEMGEVVGIMFAEAPKTVAYGQDATIGTIVAVDAKGVTTQVTDDVELSASGLAVESLNAGVVTAKDDDKYVGQTITVMAVYDDFVATTEIAVVEQAATIKLVSAEAEVGISTKLVGRIVDAEGKATTIDENTVTVKAIVLDKPENAVVVANATPANALVDGNAIINFMASAPGEYKLQTIVTYVLPGADNNYNTSDDAVKYISGIETITVAGGVNAFNDVVVISMGANSMIVNNELVKLDVAPFIENSRTMLQYNVLYVFGIDVKWVPETNSVVAEGNGTKVVMTLGSKVATVNGEEVALDVAPYVVNGRTVVPVGLITGVFDINFDFTRNADGSIADILFTK